MKTLGLRELRFRREALAPESLASLDFALAELDRAERKRRTLWGRLKSLLLPADWFRGYLEDFALGRTLVIGCGRGLESLAMGAVGLDLDPAKLRIAGDLRRHLEDARGSVLGGDGVRLPLASGVFDTVISNNVVEHIAGPQLPGHLREVLRVLKAGGRYAMHTPNGVFENPPARPDHVSLHSYAEWERMLLDAGFTETRTPRRRSGALVSPDWKKARERAAAGGRRPMGTSHHGLRMVTLVASKPG